MNMGLFFCFAKQRWACNFMDQRRHCNFMHPKMGGFARLDYDLPISMPFRLLVFFCLRIRLIITLILANEIGSASNGKKLGKFKIA